MTECTCKANTDGIRLCYEHHRYWFGRKELASVSSVVKTVYAKKSWDGVDEAIIENARDRGIKVDDYIAEYIRTGRVSIQPGERQDVIDRVIIAVRLLEENYRYRRSAIAQRIVFNLGFGVAGTADIEIDEDTVIDLKSTYQPEVDWKLQIGAYAFLGGYKKAAIIHVSPKFYKNERGGKLLHYDVDECIGWWSKALQWWTDTKLMEKHGQKEKRISA